MKNSLSKKIEEDFAYEKKVLPSMKDRRKTKAEWVVAIMNILVGAGILAGMLLPLL
ncbi:hypothetical protein OZX69_03720 [Lactobacillus sp. ESL0731]|uniref:hypothetical protein n=1 Tax=unclassified Lactobacillus TaxID=2620435 RepID=UPI0023F8E5A3|nr:MULTISPECIES: hypothetical protein [unclassified Lactobacillus]WEV51818.1 hypothetical protein OZX63_03720 [Lactobacillus sp. ESL0700]WEV62947.1 hypothetical protein OZX69_03720 [Lactobacillus sp. ESL0731]